MMARALLLLALVALVGCPPPVEPVPPPAPTPAPAPVEDPAPITVGDVTVAYENGVRIVVKRVESAELAAMQLYIRGGARLRKAETAGVELLALNTAVAGGTEELDKHAFSRRLTEMGSELGAGAFHAYSVIAAKSLTEEIEPTFRLLTSAFLTPAMPENEIELQRQQQLAIIKQRDVTPDGRLELLVNEAMYTGHPYANLPTGTLESVGGLTPAMLAEHLASLRQSSRLELVVVGNVTAEQVRGLVRDTLGALPRGDYRHEAVPVPKFDKPKLAVIGAELPTNYVEASFPAPRWDSPDFPASILAMRVLSRRVWEEVRTKRNLSYAPAARHGWSGELPRGALYVTAVDPNTTMKVMLDEVRSLKTTPIGDKELEGAKSVFVTSHLMSNESTDGQASWLAMCDIIGGDFRLATSLPERVKAITAQEIQAFAKEHIHDLQTVVLGPASDLDQALFESL